MIEKQHQSFTATKISLKRSRKEHQSTAFSLNAHTLSFNNQLSIPKVSDLQLEKTTAPYEPRGFQNDLSPPRTALKPRYSESPKDRGFKIDELINSRIQSDNRISSSDPTILARSSVFREEGNRLAIGPRFPLPPKVTQIYAQETSNHPNQGINFTHGCLTQTGLYYFSINRKLLFYNIKTLYHSDLGHFSLDSPKVFEVEDIIYTIKEVKNHTSELLDPKIGDRLLIFSHPWSFGFYSYDMEGQDSSVMLHNLQLKFNLRCQRVLHIDYDHQGRFYYLNSLDGTLNVLSISAYSWFMSLKTGRYALKNYAASKSYGLSRTLEECLAKKTTFCKRLKYFYKYFQSSVKSVFPTQYRCLGMFVDREREMVFCLTEWDENVKIIGQNGVRCVFAYSFPVGNTAPTLRGKITQERLYKDHSALTIGVSRQSFKIVQIFPVSKQIKENTNIEVLLSNGIRIGMFLDIRIKYTDIVKPPNREKFSHERLKATLIGSNLEDTVTSRNLQSYQKELVKSIECFDFSSEKVHIPHQETYNLSTWAVQAHCAFNNQFLAVMRTGNKFFSYFSDKPGSSSDNEKDRISEVRWLSIKENVKIQRNSHEQYQFAEKLALPIEFKLYRVKDQAFLNLDEQMLLDQQYAFRKITRNPKDQLTTAVMTSSDFIPRSNETLHDLARQVHYPPDYYLMVTDCSMESMIYLRPIDVVFTILISENDKHKVDDLLLAYCFTDNKYTLSDLCQMLLQIYYDQSGAYYLSNQLLQKVNYDPKRTRKLKHIDYNTEQYSRRLYNKVNVGGRLLEHCQLTQDFLTKVYDFITTLTEREARSELQKDNIINSNEISKKTVRLSSDRQILYYSPEKLIKAANQLRIDFLLTHISRLVRTVWHSPIDELPIKANITLAKKLTNLKKVSFKLLDLREDNVFLMRQKISNPIAIIVPSRQDAANEEYDFKLDQFLTTLNRIIELLNFLQHVNFLPKQHDAKRNPWRVLFSNALSKPMQFWQRSMFLTIIDQGHTHEILDIWSELFPSFIRQSFRTIIRISLQLCKQESEQKVIETLKNLTTTKIPSYLIDFLKKVKDFKSIEIFISPSQSVNFDSSFQAERNQQRKIDLPKSFKVVQDFTIAFNELKDSYKPIKEKKFVLLYLQRNLESLRDRGEIDETGFRLKVQGIRKIQRTLSMQQYIKERYQIQLHLSVQQRLKQKSGQIENYQEFYQDVLSGRQQAKIIERLEKETFNYKDLRVLIDKMGSIQLSLIYYGMFGESEYGDTVKGELLEFYSQIDAQTKQRWPECIKVPLERVVYDGNQGIKVSLIIETLSVYELKGIVRASDLLESIRVISAYQSSDQEKENLNDSTNQWYHRVTLDYFKEKRGKSAYKSLYEKEMGKFWIPSFLFSLGYSRQRILQQYFDALVSSFNKSTEFNTVSEFQPQKIKPKYYFAIKYFYIWLNIYVYIKKCYATHSRQFTRLGQGHLDNLKKGYKNSTRPDSGFNWSFTKVRNQSDRPQEAIIEFDQNKLEQMRTILRNLS